MTKPPARTLMAAAMVFVICGLLIACSIDVPPTSTPKPTSTPVSDEYIDDNIVAWYRDLGSSAWQVRGVVTTGLDRRNNQIMIEMLPRRGGLAELKAVIAESGIPRRAVAIEVGCAVPQTWAPDPRKAPSDAFLSSIEHSVEAVSEASYGETIRMKLVLRNISSRPVEFYMGGRPPHDLMVTTPSGKQVWHWKCARVAQMPLDVAKLRPGEIKEFTGEWEQVDNRGNPVPSGTYLVYGILDMESPEMLVTQAHELQVLE